MIAYEVLRKLQAAQCEVTLLLTIGSPLGLPAVRSMFKQDIGKEKLPFPPCVRAWYNVADRLDPVALDGDLSDDIQGANGRFSTYTAPGINPDGPRNPHSGSGYLSIAQVRQHVRAVVGPGFDQPVTSTVVLKDLSDRMEAHGSAMRHEVLIELDRLPAGKQPAQARQALLDYLRQLAAPDLGLQGAALDEAIMLEDTMERFISAQLTRFEIESLRNQYQALGFKRLWRDAGKRALLDRSRVVIQADAAQNAYHALGQGIGWAVLDTGIAAGHPHFYQAGGARCGGGAAGLHGARPPARAQARRRACVHPSGPRRARHPRGRDHCRTLFGPAARWRRQDACGLHRDRPAGAAVRLQGAGR